MTRTQKLFLLCGIFLTLLSSAVWSAAPPPAAVSPGNATGVALIGERCPTFLWGGEEGVKSFELVVYRLGEEGAIEPAAAVLQVTLPGSAHGWKPSLERCLEPGGRYAWSLRSLGRRGASDWSEPALFEVAEVRSETTLEEAIRVLRTYVEEAGAEAPTSAAPGVDSEASSGSLGAPSRATGLARVDRGPEAIGVAALTIEGEVRTVNSTDAPRLWGRGRPGTERHKKIGAGGLPELCGNGQIGFGLSDTAVDWGSAADACPAGTWVCTAAERGVAECDTLRSDLPSLLFDGDFLECPGAFADWPATDHEGWVADAAGTTWANFVSEQGVNGVHKTCYTMPVWCCSQ